MTLNINLETKDLLKALGIVSSASEKKNTTIPILSYLKLSAQDSLLSISATDSDIEIIKNIGANITKEGEIAVPTHTFNEVIKKIQDREINLKFDHNSSQLEITGAKCNFKLPTLLATNFPTIEGFGTSVNISVKIAEFSKILEHTRFAASNEETRYNLNGVYLHLDQKAKLLTAVATDCHRLSISSIEIDTNSNIGAIIPSRAIQEILKICKEDGKTVDFANLTINQNMIELTISKTTLRSKIIDGVFPDYSAFIPDTNQHKFIADPRILLNAIERVATVIIENKYKAIKLLCSAKSIKINAFGINGIANEELDLNDYTAFSYNGPNLTIGFNPKYITDVLYTLIESEVEIQLRDDSSPVLVLCKDYPNSRFIIMPINV